MQQSQSSIQVSDDAVLSYGLQSFDQMQPPSSPSSSSPLPSISRALRVLRGAADCDAAEPGAGDTDEFKLSQVEETIWSAIDYHVTSSIICGMGMRIQMLQQVEPELYRMGAITAPFADCPAISPHTFTAYRRLVPPTDQLIIAPVNSILDVVKTGTPRVADAFVSGIGHITTGVQSVFNASPETIESTSQTVEDLGNSLRSATQRAIAWLGRRTDQLILDAERKRQENAEILARSGENQLLPDSAQRARFCRSSTFDVMAWRARMHSVERTPSESGSPLQRIPLLMRLEDSLSNVTGGLVLRESWLNLCSWLSQTLCWSIFRPRKSIPPLQHQGHLSAWQWLMMKWQHEFPASFLATSASMPFRYALLFINVVPNATFSQWREAVRLSPNGIFSIFAQTPIAMAENYLSDITCTFTAVAARNALQNAMQHAWRTHTLSLLMELTHAAVGGDVPRNLLLAPASDAGWSAASGGTHLHSRPVQSIYDEWRRNFADAVVGAPSLRDQHRIQPELNRLLHYRVDSKDDFVWMVWHLFALVYWRRSIDNGSLNEISVHQRFSLPNALLEAYSPRGRQGDSDCSTIMQYFPAQPYSLDAGWIAPPSTLPSLSFFDGLPSTFATSEFVPQWDSEASSSLTTLLPLLPARFIRIICALAISAADAELVPEAAVAGVRVQNIYSELNSRIWGASHRSQTLASTTLQDLAPPFIYSDVGDRVSGIASSRSRWLAQALDYYIKSPIERIVLMVASEFAIYPLKTLRYRVAIGLGYPRALSYSNYIQAAFNIWANEGIGAFYAGFTTIVERSVLQRIASDAISIARWGYTKLRKIIVDNVMK